MWEVKILFCTPILGTYTHVSNLEWPVPITNSFALLRARWDDSSLLALPTLPLKPRSYPCLWYVSHACHEVVLWLIYLQFGTCSNSDALQPSFV